MSKIGTIAMVNGEGDAPALSAVIRATRSEIVQAARAIGTAFGDSA
jgi:hypothetical protein